MTPSVSNHERVVWSVGRLTLRGKGLVSRDLESLRRPSFALSVPNHGRAARFIHRLTVRGKGLVSRDLVSSQRPSTAQSQDQTTDDQHGPWINPRTVNGDSWMAPEFAASTRFKWGIV
uniref:Uncharacterized protein n=1 Tax=Solanum tuberosum TaxID=4113 RepID=M1DAR8_SOLTU